MEHRHEYTHDCEHFDAIMDRIDAIDNRLFAIEFLAGMNIVEEQETQDKLEELEDKIEDVEDAIEDDTESDDEDESESEDESAEDVPVEDDDKSDDKDEDSHESESSTPSRGMAFGRRR